MNKTIWSKGVCRLAVALGLLVSSVVSAAPVQIVTNKPVINVPSLGEFTYKTLGGEDPAQYKGNVDWAVARIKRYTGVECKRVNYLMGLKTSDFPSESEFGYVLEKAGYVTDLLRTENPANNESAMYWVIYKKGSKIPVGILLSETFLFRNGRTPLNAMLAYLCAA